MKSTPIRSLFAALVLSLILTLIGCGGGTQDGDKTHDTIDTPQVVKVEPQNFPVNDLPDSLFGKLATVKKGTVKAPAANLTANQTPLPDWLDQIVSRESIVLFAKGILNSMPDEVEFVQSSSTHYDGPDGWKAFCVAFSTRPSEASMVVYGAYQDEQRSYWASTTDKGKMSMALKAAAAKDNGVELWGESTLGDKATPFHAVLAKSSTTVEQ